MVSDVKSNAITKSDFLAGIQCVCSRYQLVKVLACFWRVLSVQLDGDLSLSKKKDVE